jgi:hypothetical protein
MRTRLNERLFAQRAVFLCEADRLEALNADPWSITSLLAKKKNYAPEMMIFKGAMPCCTCISQQLSSST